MQETTTQARRATAWTWARSDKGTASIAIGALFVVVLVFPRGMPAGVYATGLVFGARAALATLGLVLVYRSSRILNFAQVQLGAPGGILFFELVRHHTLVRGLDAMCHCVGAKARPDRWAVHLEYWSAIVVALLVSCLLSLAVYLLVVRRFRDSPPLVGTVATIAISSVLAYGAGLSGIPRLFKDKDLGGAVPPPLDVSVHLHPSVLHLPDIAALVVGVLAMVGLMVFLSRSRIGVAVRATAENAERASTLGVNATTVSSVVWLAAGLLSGLATVLLVMSSGAAGGVGGPSALVRVLGAAILAGMVSLPLAAAAAVGIGVLDQGFLWSFRNGLLVDTVVVGLVMVFLLARRQPRIGRVDPAGGSWRAAREVRPVPRELRDLPEVRRLRRRTGVVIGALVVLYPFLVSTGDVAAASVALVYGMVGLSLLLLTGWAGLISLGQFAFAAVGGYAVAYFGGRLGLPFLVAIPLAGIAGAIVALAVGLPALRIRGLYLAVTTLGLALVTSQVLLNERYGGRYVPASLSRPSIVGLSTTDERAFYFLALAFLVLTLFAVAGLRRSATARALIATRDNDRAAQAFGVNIMRARLAVFAASGLIAAVAGALFTYQQQGLAPGNYGVEISLSLFLMVVIGGLGSAAGPLLGAVFVAFLTQNFGGVASLYTSVVVILILVAAEGGLTQVVFGVRDGMLRRIATRRGIRVPSLVADGAADTGDGRVPIRPMVTGGGTASYVPVVYRLPRRVLHVPRVASRGKGA